MRNLKVMHETCVGVAFPNEETQHWLGFFARVGEESSKKCGANQSRAFHRASRKTGQGQQPHIAACTRNGTTASTEILRDPLQRWLKLLFCRSCEGQSGKDSARG